MPDSFSDPESAQRGGETGSRRGGSPGGDNSFFAEIGLSQGRAGDPAPSASADRKADPKADRKPAAAAAAKSDARESKRRLPPLWLIITGAGLLLVVVMLAVSASLNSSAEPTATRTAATTKSAVGDAAEQSPIQFGPHTVSGPVNDRTTLSPVTGASAEVPVERHGDLLLADVRINDVAVGKFLLDTGTRDIVVSRDIADKLHLPKRRTKDLRTPSGLQPAIERRIDSLSLGAVRFEERMILPPPSNDEWLAVAIDMKPWAERLHVPIVGVIGGEVWSQTPFSIDPAHNIVTFFKRGPFPFSAGLNPEFLTRFDNFEKPAITANLDHGPERTFLLATGAPAELMVKGSAKTVKTLTAFGQEINDPVTIESKVGDGYFDPANDRQAGVIGAGILSRYVLMLDYANAKFLALPIKK